jgi:hypothetical protein
MTIDWNHIAHPGPANRHLAPRAQVMMGGGTCRLRYDGYAASYDRWDRSHFDDRGIGRRSDVWDNRRETAR